MREYMRNGFTLWLKWLITKIKLEFHYRKQHFKIGYMSLLINTRPNMYNTIYENVYLNNVDLGDFTYVSKDTSIMNASIGKFCSIGQDCKIGLGIHPVDYISTHPIFYSPKKQAQITFENEKIFDEYENITIGNDVWIGSRVMIADGVTIGNGAIIAAGTVVTIDVSDYAIIAGIPGKLIRFRFDQDKITILNKFAWWDKDMDWLQVHKDGMKHTQSFFEQIKG